MSAYQFTRTQRLLKAAEFQSIFDNTVFKVGDTQFVVLARPNNLEYPRLGLVIAKKKVRLSVDRNRIKRLVRESFRLNQLELPAVDILFLARQMVTSTETNIMRQSLEKAWQRLNRKVCNQPSQKDTGEKPS